MQSLSELYSSISRPNLIYNNEGIRQLIELYRKSDRTNLFGVTGLYDSLVRLNKTVDNSHVNTRDKEHFFVTTYNDWIKNILNLNERQLRALEQNGVQDIRKVQDYLRKFGMVNTLEDINRLKEDKLFDKDINGWELEDGWNHIKSRYISGRQEKSINFDIKHRLYINCQYQDIYKFAIEFRKKCGKYNIPYYFKFPVLESMLNGSERDDKIVIYSRTEDLLNYFNIANEILKENPDIAKRMGPPPKLTGKINGLIGIADEPIKDATNTKESYNSLRARILEDAIETTIIMDIYKFKNSYVNLKNKQVKFNEIFLNTAIDQLIKKSNQKANINRELMYKGLQKNISKGLARLTEVKDKKDTLARTNGEAIFYVPINSTEKIKVDILSMDRIIKEMAFILLEIDPEFERKVSDEIFRTAQRKGVDGKTFCLNIQTKEEFFKYDKTQLNAIKKSNSDFEKKFVEGFINAYDLIENEYQKEIRIKKERKNIERVKKIVENGIDESLRDYLNVKIVDIPNTSEFGVEYSQEQVLAIIRLLKAAKELTENEKLNPEKKDYLAEFTKVSDINYILKQLRSDLKKEDTYMHRLREEARRKKLETQEEKIEIFDVNLPATKDKQQTELEKMRKDYEELSQPTHTEFTQKELEEAIRIYEEGTSEAKQTSIPIQAKELRPGITKVQIEEQKRKENQERYRKSQEEKHKKEEEQRKKIEEAKKRREQEQTRQQQLEDLKRAKEMAMARAIYTSDKNDEQLSKEELEAMRAMYEDDSYNPTWYMKNENKNTNGQRHGMRH